MALPVPADDLADTAVPNCLVPLRGLEAKFQLAPRSDAVDQTVGAQAIIVHVTAGLRRPALRHEDSDLVLRLRRLGPEMPLHGGVVQIVARVALLATNQVYKLVGIADEENQRVVADHVAATLLGIEID